MATQIIWDEEPTDVTSPEPAQKLVKTPRDEFLETVPIDKLIAELTRRMISTGIPSPITTTPYVSYPTITTTSGTYTIPQTGTTITSMLSNVGLGNVFTWK